RHDLLAAAPDVVRVGTIAALGYQGARFHDILPGHFAVETDLHDAGRAQQREQDFPSRPGVGEVMQHARCLDDIEVAPERAHFHDVSLREFDIGDAESLRHALGVADTG